MKTQYDVKGNQILRALVTVQPVIGVNPQYPQIQMKPPNYPYQQVPNQYYKPQPNYTMNQMRQPKIQPQIEQQIQDKSTYPNSGRNLNQNNA